MHALGLCGQASDNASGMDALLDVKVGRRLVNEENLRIRNAGKRARETLQLTAREVLKRE